MTVEENMLNNKVPQLIPKRTLLMCSTPDMVHGYPSSRALYTDEQHHAPAWPKYLSEGEVWEVHQL